MNGMLKKLFFIKFFVLVNEYGDEVKGKIVRKDGEIRGREGTPL